MLEILLIYIMVINIAGICLMWSDKRRAIENAWRIPEKTLFTVAFLGGAVGILLGMYRFRHKTKHWYFKYGIPVILLGELILLVYVLLR